ncbi:MAG: hypothetical protein E7365_00215 [Clostridiales bacterium]|nr:hypothetical protein [Clostridiales bacterium]
MKKIKLVTKKTSRIIAWSVLRDYLYYLSDTKRIIINNFLAGLFKGFGSAIGFLIISGILLYLLTLLASRNLPIIGDLLQELVDFIKYRY